MKDSSGEGPNPPVAGNTEHQGSKPLAWKPLKTEKDWKFQAQKNLYPNGRCCIPSSMAMGSGSSIRAMLLCCPPESTA
jgi:hypothetical protein